MSWKLDWLMIVPLAATMAAYVVGARRVRVPRMELAAFVTGWVVLVVALLSPIATLSEVLFSVHMTQHELLMLVAAPLLALGRPLVPLMFALPARHRLRLKGGAGLSPAVRQLSSPAVVFVLHALALWVWHLPALYQAAVLDDRVHALQHVMFTGTACLFWWGLLRGRYGRLGYGAAVIYVFATAVHSGGLGALITFATAPLYPLYVHRAAHGVDPLVDQQIAGLIMWVPAGVVLTIFALAIFSAWLGEAERRRRIAAAIALLAAGTGVAGGQVPQVPRVHAAQAHGEQVQDGRSIRVKVARIADAGDYGLGVRLGASEADRAAQLLGHSFALVESGHATASIGPDAAALSAPAVAMRGPAAPCVFVTTSDPPPAAQVVDWHPAFRRYGASELNERFEKAFNRPMSSEAWHGWVAVKAVLEAALRGDNLCDALARLRFDGHKGRVLSFDPVTRVLRHPRLRVITVDGKQTVDVVEDEQ